MLGRLITTIVCLVLLAFFAGFNLDNRCNVNLLFHTFENVPVFFTIITSFIVGIVFTIPFVFIYRGKSSKKDKPAKIKEKGGKKSGKTSFAGESGEAGKAMYSDGFSENAMKSSSGTDCKTDSRSVSDRGFGAGQTERKDEMKTPDGKEGKSE